ncbi:hypothetical protein PVA44_07375 (plasmid) [Entomospira nematocerorum]|uniref:Uncharacterized protein n=1 Tax=Entomospira nematocerorum TaxID=2719987 RepID=A0A968KTJ1_9SPIO|nr:hypothetical protein [Entomospira nematocera]NIZ47730.1 hypothetical protein [Entomospira nematocera]WDI34657.1 hypothetical protein PVA44_07375 [Entomospira nematocera]
MAYLEVDDKEDKYLIIVYAYRNKVKAMNLDGSAEQSKMRNHDVFFHLYFLKYFKKLICCYFNDNERRTQGGIEGELSNE